MRIKTRESQRTLKTFDSTKSISQKANNSVLRFENYSEQIQNTEHESEYEYAGDRVQSAEEKTAKTVLSGAGKFGRWGVRETLRNMDKWRKRPVKRNGTSLKLLPSPQRKTLRSDSNKTVKSSRKAAKETVKASKRAAQTAKKVAQAAAEVVKIAVKATITALKATVAGIKVLVAAIAAGGWLVIVIILLTSIVALAAGSVYGIFISNETGGEININQTIHSLNYEYEEQLESIKSQYTYDYFTIEGNDPDWKEVLAVYAVKLNLDPYNPEEVATFNEEKAGKLKTVFWDMNSLSARLEVKNEKETHAELNENSEVVMVGNYIIKTYLTISQNTISAMEMAEFYGFSDTQINALEELLNESELWNGILSDY